MKRNIRIIFTLATAIAWVVSVAVPARAIPLDEDGNINVSIRGYTNVRIGTMAKQSTRAYDPKCPNCFGGTYPYSGAGNVLQNRYFAEVEWDHDILPYIENSVPDWLSNLQYTLAWRGEYEGIYDWGPNPYSHGYQEAYQEIYAALLANPTPVANPELVAQQRLGRVRHRLREVASMRNRLFQAYIEADVGDLFLRFGRQNLVWGETDVFRLMDNINPVDNSFGGFFIDLDERRVPLDMLRSSYFIGDLGPIDQAFVEGYVALDNTVAFIPGAPAGSPWANPLGPPTGRTPGVLLAPSNGFDGARGGARFVFNAVDTTFTLASYFTRLDLQQVRFRRGTAADPDYQPGVTIFAAEQTAPRVWLNGVSATTPVPALKGIFRSEFAWIRDEAVFAGPTGNAFPGLGSLTDGNYVSNFLGPALNQGVKNLPPGTKVFDTAQQSDSANFVMGWDMNQYIQALNPTQSFLFSTQFFMRHYFDVPQCNVFKNRQNANEGMESVNCFGVPVPLPNNSTRIVSRKGTEMLQTFLVNTTYNVTLPLTDMTAQVTPGFGMFYDWQGMLVFQPSMRVLRDPWRFIVDYSAINSGVFKYQFGLARDRSNVRFQIEYVL